MALAHPQILRELGIETAATGPPMPDHMVVAVVMRVEHKGPADTVLAGIVSNISIADAENGKQSSFPDTPPESNPLLSPNQVPHGQHQ